MRPFSEERVLVFTTHALCTLCREAAFSSRSPPTLSRGIQRERAQNVISKLELQLPISYGRLLRTGRLTQSILQKGTEAPAIKNYP